MGQLYYGNSVEPIEIPDRLLAHVKVVVATKLRRSESFTLSWREGAARGRTTIWLQPAIPLRFVFASAEPEMLDPAFLKELANAANSSRGLHIEPAAALPDENPTAPAASVRVAAPVPLRAA